MPPLRPTQCRNCQRLGHAAISCHYPTLCRRCSGPHSLETCTYKDKSDIKCVNCAGPHMASDRKCPMYLQARYAKLCKDAARPESSLLPVQRQRAIYNALSHSAKLVHKDVPSYANVLSQGTPKLPPTATPWRSINAYSALLRQEIQLLIQRRRKLNKPTTILEGRLAQMKQWR